MLGPFPARRVRGAANREAADADDLEASLFEFAQLVGMCELFQYRVDRQRDSSSREDSQPTARRSCIRVRAVRGDHQLRCRSLPFAGSEPERALEPAVKVALIDESQLRGD